MGVVEYSRVEFSQSRLQLMEKTVTHSRRHFPIRSEIGLAAESGVLDTWVGDRPLTFVGLQANAVTLVHCTCSI